MIFLITAEPRLPPLELVIETQNPAYSGWEREHVRCTAHIEYTDHGRNDRTASVTVEADGNRVSLTFGDELLGGTLVVSAVLYLYRQSDAGDEFGSTQIDARHDVRGQNPTKTDIKALLPTTTLKVIAYKESRFAQFSNGLPKFGPPNGYGIMQSDNPNTTAAMIWNWRTNVDAGIEILADSDRVTRRHFQNLITAHPKLPELSDSEMHIAIVESYNAGTSPSKFYWLPNADFTGWVKNSITTYTEYGDDVVRLEGLVDAGNFPDDWN